MNLHDIFKRHEDEFLKFDNVAAKESKRPDLHAFLLLEKLLPGDNDMISSAEHDKIWLDIDCSKLANIISEEQIIDLVRCGISYDEEYDSLYLFV